MKNKDIINIIDYISMVEIAGVVPSAIKKGFDLIKKIKLNFKLEKIDIVFVGEERFKLYSGDTIWVARDKFKNWQQWAIFLKEIIRPSEENKRYLKDGFLYFKQTA